MLHAGVELGYSIRGNALVSKTKTEFLNVPSYASNRTTELGSIKVLAELSF